MQNSITNADGKLKQHAQQALDALKAAKVTIITAESCTAGSIAALLAQAEGASDILHGGFITYTKEHKAKALGVSVRLLKEHSAVNPMSSNSSRRELSNVHRLRWLLPSAACSAPNPMKTAIP